MPTTQQMEERDCKAAVIILDRLRRLLLQGRLDPCIFCDELQGWLSELNSNDLFGTEGQNDPRGDFREREWTVRNYQKWKE